MNYVTCKACEWRYDSTETLSSSDFTKCSACADTRKVRDPKELLCNMCGNSVCPTDGSFEDQSPYGLFETKIQGGYSSYHLFDLTSYTFSVCEECLRKMFMQFKIEPIVKSIDIDGRMHLKISWDQDVIDYQYRVWRDTGGHHQAYTNSLCNQIKDCANKAVYTILDMQDEFSENCSCKEHCPNDFYRVVDFIPNILRSFI